MTHPRLTTTGELRRLRRLAYLGFTPAQAGRAMNRDGHWVKRWAAQAGISFSVHRKQTHPHPAPDILIAANLNRMMAGLAALARAN